MTAAVACRRIVLLNPNTSASTTEDMVALARAACGDAFVVEGRTAPFGSSFIIDHDGLETSARAVVEMVAQIAAEGHTETGLIVAAFGDPGLEGARRLFAGPVVGIGESGLLAGASGSRLFSVVTSTAGLGGHIERMAGDLGLAAQLRSVRSTASHPSRLVAKPELLFAELLQAAQDAVSIDGAQAIVVGGGPLARFARGLEQRLAVPVVGPVSSATAMILHRFGHAGGHQPSS